MMIECGQYDTVLVCGGEKMPRGFIRAPPERQMMPVMLTTCDGLALEFPILLDWALECKRRMHEHGTTESSLAKVVVKAREIRFIIHTPGIGKQSRLRKCLLRR